MKQSRNQLKQWFKKFAYPTESQFWDWMDSYWHKDDNIPASQIDGLQQVVNGVTDGIGDVLNQKQDIHDENLETNNKTIIGAINEVKEAVDSIEIPDILPITFFTEDDETFTKEFLVREDQSIN